MAGILWHALRKSLGFETLPEKVEQLKQLRSDKSGLVARKAIRFWSFCNATFVFGCIAGVWPVPFLKNIFPTTYFVFGERWSQKNGNCGL